MLTFNIYCRFFKLEIFSTWDFIQFWYFQFWFFQFPNSISSLHFWIRFRPVYRNWIVDFGIVGKKKNLTLEIFNLDSSTLIFLTDTESMHVAFQYSWDCIEFSPALPYLMCNAMPSCCQLYMPCSIAANYYLACTSLSRMCLFYNLFFPFAPLLLIWIYV